MKYDFDEIINRRGTSSYKWDKLKELFGRDELLPMWVADMDFKSPPAVIEALTERAKHGVFGYTARSDEFYQSFMDWVMEKHGWRIKKRWVVDSRGSAGYCNSHTSFYKSRRQNFGSNSGVLPFL